MNVLDLFCGCGWLSKGICDAGLNIIAGIDIWQPAINSYSKNFKHLAICKDLQNYPPQQFQQEFNIDNKSIDIIVGGVPCQGFSLAGKRDQNDPRNSLFIEFIKYIDYYHPKAFIIENVIGILSMKTTSNLKVIDICHSTHKYLYEISSLMNYLYIQIFFWLFQTSIERGVTYRVMTLRCYLYEINSSVFLYH